MADLLQQANDWLASQRKAHASQSVTYRRGTDSVVVSASIGSTRFEQEDRDGLVVRSQVRDYLIDVADLVLSGGAIEPEVGDLIEETVGSQTHVYQVLPLGGEPAWRYSDPYRKTYRIHTKRVDVT